MGATGIELIFRRSPTVPEQCGIYESHPVVGWDRAGDPLILHWRTGRPVPARDFIAENSNGDPFSYQAVSSNAAEVDLGEFTHDAFRAVMLEVGEGLDQFARGIAGAIHDHGRAMNP